MEDLQPRPVPSSTMSLRARAIDAARRAAGPAVVAGILLWAGRERAAPVVAIVAVVVLAMGLVAPLTMQALDRCVGRLARGIAVALSTLLAGLAWLLVVLPIWALSKLFGYSPLDAGWTSRRTAWIRHPEGRTPNGQARDVSRMSGLEQKLAPTARRRARARFLVPVAAVAGLPLFVHFIDVPWLSIDMVQGEPADGGDEISWDGFPVDNYAHEAEPWAKNLFRELTELQSFHDHVLGHRLRDSEGRYVNVVHGRRVSHVPAKRPQLTVWFFGGSTMFGIGQRDLHTLPSLISQASEDAGLPIKAVNFGVSADNNWAQTLRFAEALSNEAAPDLAVFYDGVNEHGVAWQRVQAGNLEVGTLERYGLSEEQRNAHRASYGGLDGADFEAEMELISQLGASQYAISTDVAKRLAASHRVPAINFWQPSPYTKVPSPHDEILWDRLETNPVHLSMLHTSYDEILRRSSVDAIDLSGVLNVQDRAIYFDASHTNEYGARLVSEAMYEHLEPTLAELARDSEA